jgi:hypothetical protein
LKKEDTGQKEISSIRRKETETKVNHRGRGKEREGVLTEERMK